MKRLDRSRRELGRTPSGATANSADARPTAVMTVLNSLGTKAPDTSFGSNGSHWTAQWRNRPGRATSLTLLVRRCCRRRSGPSLTSSWGGINGSMAVTSNPLGVVRCTRVDCHGQRLPRICPLHTTSARSTLATADNWPPQTMSVLHACGETTPPVFRDNGDGRRTPLRRASGPSLVHVVGRMARP